MSEFNMPPGVSTADIPGNQRDPDVLEALEAARQFILDRSASERRREAVLAALLEAIEFLEAA